MPPTNLAPAPRISYVTLPDGTVYEIGARLEAHKFSRHSDVDFKPEFMLKGAVPTWDPDKVNPDLSVGGWTTGLVDSPNEVEVSETEPVSPLVEWWVKPVLGAVAAPKGVWDHEFIDAASLADFTFIDGAYNESPAADYFDQSNSCFAGPILVVGPDGEQLEDRSPALPSILQPYAGQQTKIEIEYDILQPTPEPGAVIAVYLCFKEGSTKLIDEELYLGGATPPSVKGIASIDFTLPATFTAPKISFYVVNSGLGVPDWRMRVWKFRLLDSAGLPLGAPPATRAIGVPEEGSSVELYYRPAPGQPFLPIPLGVPEVYAHDGSVGDLPVAAAPQFWVDTSQVIDVAPTP